METNELEFSRLLVNAYSAFVEFYELAPSQLCVDEVILLDICKRYFKDVDRLHRYHNIKRIDPSKIAGFSTYWITKLRPISVIDKSLYNKSANFCIYVNEIFALFVAFGRFLSSGDVSEIGLNKNYIDSFLYTLKYRKTSGDTLALIYLLAAESFQ